MGPLDSQRLASIPSINRQGLVKPNATINFNPSTPPKSWKEICSSGRVVPEDCKLQFYEPLTNEAGDPVVHIPNTVIASNASRWGSTLSGYVLGNRSFYAHLKACVSRLWRLKCSLEIFSRDNGYFFFKFGDEAECERVLQGGPWLFDGRLIVLKKWAADQGLDRDAISEVPVWVRFNNLSLKYWSGEGLGRIASSIGKPLYTDGATASLERISYARVFIEIKANVPRPKSILVEEEGGGSNEVEVEYEWIPPECIYCKCFGHLSDRCTGTHEWREKTRGEAPAKDSPNTSAPQADVGGANDEAATVNSPTDNDLESIHEAESEGEEEEVEEEIDTSELEMGDTGKTSTTANSHISSLPDCIGKLVHGHSKDGGVRPPSLQGEAAATDVASGPVLPLANTVRREIGSLHQARATSEVASGEAMPAANVSVLRKSGENVRMSPDQTAIPHISHDQLPDDITVVNPEWEEAVKERKAKCAKAPSTSKPDRPRKSGRQKSNQ